MKKIPLRGKYGLGKFALVDDDYEWLSQFKWYVSPQYYIRRNMYRGYDKYTGKVDNTAVLLHRQVLGVGKGIYVDHIDHNTFNNCKSNLRICSNSQNCYNQRGRGGSSEYKGVSWDAARAKWEAQIMCNYKRIYIGRFSSEYEAAAAYNAKAKELFGEYAFLNKTKL